MELHVLSDRQLGSVAEWQQAIDAEGFPLRLTRSVDLLTINGFLPVQLRETETGFECFQDDEGQTMNFLGRDNFDQHRQFAFGIRWGSGSAELLAVWMAATAYAIATGGIIFDHEEGKTFTKEQARETVQGMLREAPRVESIIGELKQKFTTQS